MSAEEEILCPSCNKRLKLSEVAKHCEEEMNSLRQLTAETIEATSPDQPKFRTTFQRVQRNRQTRLRQRTRKRPPSVLTDFPCPVCNNIFGKDDIQRHAEQCLRRSNGNTNDDSSSDEDADEFEEYEWAGQKRIRASTLLQGGYAAIGIGQPSTNRNGSGQGDVDDDEDLNVDEDDTHIYGPSQYNENDIISAHSTANGSVDESDITSYMRSLITGNNKNNTSDNTDIIQSTTIETTYNVNTPTTSNTTVTSSGASSLQSCQQIIESLKSKLQHYEQQMQSKFKCLICLEDYRQPTISVCCWHVHCEECWLRSLGTRKLCPQCNLITTPKDLRRIYL